MDVNQLTKIVIAWEMYGSRVPKSHIASQLCVHRETIHLWVESIEKAGLTTYLEQYTKAKKGERAKRKVDGLLKATIWRLREENRDCCAQKITEYLREEAGTYLSPKSVYKVLAEKYKLRSKWKKNQKRGPVPKANKPREVIQMDTVDFGYVFAFTGIDIFSKDVSVKLYPSLTSSDGADFLKHSMDKRYKHTDLLQTDGGPEFKGEFRQNVFSYTDRFRIARPYKKNEQAYIESFNRSLRKECLGWGKYSRREIPTLQKEVDSWMDYWHTKRIHLAHMKTPNQVLQEYKVSDI
ncbi:MAG: integrase core domain-containing protein [bacterium]|nr:integrase core domain-containing protein [bacterium]